MNDIDYIKSIISSLKPWEILDHYDGPKFYSCRDKVGQIYLVYWVDNIASHDQWIYLKISLPRYMALKTGNIPIYYTLKNPEEKQVYLVSTGATFDVQLLNDDQIDANWLPESDDCLNIPMSSLPQQTTSPSEEAGASNRQVLDISLIKQNNLYEVGCGKLGKVLDSIQNLVYALACGTNNIKRIPKDIMDENELFVTGVFESSFGIRLQSGFCPLFQANEDINANKILTYLLSQLNKPESILEYLQAFNVLSRTRLKHLLKILYSNNFSFNLDWGYPTGESHKSTVTYGTIKTVLDILEHDEDSSTQVVEYDGKLVGVDVESDFFAIKIGEGQIIKGKLSPKLDVHHFEVPSNIHAVIEETLTINPLTDYEKWDYVLIDINKS